MIVIPVLGFVLLIVFAVLVLIYIRRRRQSLRHRGAHVINHSSSRDRYEQDSRFVDENGNSSPSAQKASKHKDGDDYAECFPADSSDETIEFKRADNSNGDEADRESDAEADLDGGSDVDKQMHASDAPECDAGRLSWDPSGDGINSLSFKPVAVTVTASVVTVMAAESVVVPVETADQAFKPSSPLHESSTPISRGKPNTPTVKASKSQQKAGIPQHKSKTPYKAGNNPIGPRKPGPEASVPHCSVAVPKLIVPVEEKLDGRSPTDGKNSIYIPYKDELDIALAPRNKKPVDDTKVTFSPRGSIDLSASGPLKPISPALVRRPILRQSSTMSQESVSEAGIPFLMPRQPLPRQPLKTKTIPALAQESRPLEGPDYATVRKPAGNQKGKKKGSKSSFV